MATILLVEDDTTFSQLLEGFLKKHDHHVEVKNTVKQGISALEKNTYELLLLDYRLPDGNGLEVLKAAREKDPPPPAIIMTSFNDVRTAVKAIRMGAFDYITKPVNPEELLLVLNEALRKKEQREPTGRAASFDFIRGKGAVSNKLYEYLELVAPTDIAVILQGESGTGKEYAARTIHMLSKRAGKPFIAIDCGALSKELASSELFGHVKGAFTGALQDKKGQFEAASGGTLFLDEVGNLSYEVQVKLLRALQEKIIQPVGGNTPVRTDVRIIAATNDDLLQNVEKGTFREDLYHRLNEFKIDVPSLRERGGSDLTLFSNHFTAQAAAELGKEIKGLSEEVREIFSHYDWPGNLRELRNVTRRMVLLASGEIAGRETLPEEMTIQPDQHQSHLPPVGTDLKSLKEANEKEHILKVLEETRYNKSLAAKMLNIDRTTLYNKMAKYGISL
ncbi:two-component system response regulator HydG [Anseongella ginsenosidimutans]|uniref:Two-component system response regulator HydG n=1 Tax=Anseongella ginsenosidimutans TaxID=496056 RepID=A0A4R3KX23_9SPHI|nr:sigma-54 dependent transcriptional regulator [Anseongella ginsenosidimutans]QEC51350.1 sigma-54-dependent Fis family transcriptional regulator [Anseongella ginsenosidimutans]TCS89951.1 two-component system response regulator HydG [Anseongella ginsenosidimutans]